MWAAHLPDLPVDSIDDRFRQAQVGLDREGKPVLLQQALDSLAPDGKGFEGLAAIGWIKCLPQGAARPQLGEQLQGIQQVALACGVRTDEDDEGREGHFRVL